MTFNPLSAFPRQGSYIPPVEGFQRQRAINEPDWQAPRVAGQQRLGDLTAAYRANAQAAYHQTLGGTTPGALAAVNQRSPVVQKLGQMAHGSGNRRIYNKQLAEAEAREMSERRAGRGVNGFADGPTVRGAPGSRPGDPYDDGERDDFSDVVPPLSALYTEPAKWVGRAAKKQLLKGVARMKKRQVPGAPTLPPQPDNLPF